jgi:hypothetical protein
MPCLNFVVYMPCKQVHEKHAFGEVNGEEWKEDSYKECQVEPRHQFARVGTN